MSLKEYWKKRDFRETEEPKGLTGKRHKATIFVIHEHHASVMHFDLRLEIDGVLKSWSVPKGPSLDPKVKRLAVEVEDHPLAYARFDGTIPEGQYGAGRSLIWDKGLVTFEAANSLAAWESGKFSFTLMGKKLRGEFALFRVGPDKAKPTWLLVKKEDEFAESGWQLELVEPDARFILDVKLPASRKSRPSSETASVRRRKSSRKVD